MYQTNNPITNIKSGYLTSLKSLITSQKPVRLWGYPEIRFIATRNLLTMVG